MTEEYRIYETVSGKWIGYFPGNGPHMTLLTKTQIEDLIEQTYDTMSDPDTDPDIAQAAYDDHVRYTQMLEAITQ